MLAVLTIVLGALAAGAWLVAVYSFVQMLARVPAGRRGRAAGFVFRWQFGAVKQLGGDTIVRHANRFMQSVLLLAGVIVCAAALTAVAFVDAQTGATNEVTSPDNN